MHQVFVKKLGDSLVETIRKIQKAFGEDSMGHATIKEWNNRFKDGRKSAESDPRSDRPSTSRNDEVINQVHGLVLEDRRMTIRELAGETDISTVSVHSVLHDDLGLRRAISTCRGSA